MGIAREMVGQAGVGLPPALEIPGAFGTVLGRGNTHAKKIGSASMFVLFPRLRGKCSHSGSSRFAHCGSDTIQATRRGAGNTGSGQGCWLV